MNINTVSLEGCLFRFWRPRSLENSKMVVVYNFTEEVPFISRCCSKSVYIAFVDQFLCQSSFEVTIISFEVTLGKPVREIYSETQAGRDMCFLFRNITK